MQIIDFERKGNVVRFYLGEKTKEWGWTRSDYLDYKGNKPDWLKPSDRYYGDDWDDKPYEYNAGMVYDQFIKGYKDIAFDFDDIVLEPCDGDYAFPCSKDDMANRLIPCLLVIPKDYLKEHNLKQWQINTYTFALNMDGVKKYYFGDEL